MILLLFLFVAKHLPGPLACSAGSKAWVCRVSTMLSYHLRSIQSRKEARQESSSPRAVGQGPRAPQEGAQGREGHPT